MKLFKLFLTLFAVMLTVGLMAQKQISGNVKDAGNNPLIGVSILEKGTNNGTITDVDGNYSISVKGNTLTFSYVGYETKTVEIGTSTTLDVVLTEGAALDEVVITALGISRSEKSLTYSAQEVDGIELSRVKDANVINALAGKTAGIQINRSASGIGGSTRVVLRGNKSTRDNQVLYVIDGIPMFNFSPAQPNDVWGQSGGAGSGGRDGGDAISNINPDDIESMTVLKGASASALYGSQAANGVILVTTKKGKAGTTKVEFSSNMTTENILLGPKLQYAYGQTATGSLDSWGAEKSSNDHVSDFFQSGNTWINSLALSGGNKTAQTFFSYANTNSSGILPTSSLNRHNFAFRENAQFFDGKVNVGANISFINQTTNNRPTSGLYYNPLTGLYFFPRGLNWSDYSGDNFEKFNASRNTNTQNWTADQDNQQNPWWILNRDATSDRRNRLIASTVASWKINDVFTLQARGNADRSFDSYNLKAHASTQTTIANTNGRYILQKNEGTQYYGDLILTANKKFGTTSLNVNLGTSTNFTSLGTDFFDSFGADLRYANVFSLQNIKQPGGTFEQRLIRSRLNAVFASANIGFKDMIYLDITGRNDWSSTLAYTSKYSFFYPSVGLTGILSEMMKLPGIDYAKVRASWAQVGNGVLPYDTNPLNTISAANGLQVNTVGPLPGTELKPEISSSFEVGADVRFLNNRVGLDLTYYSTTTANQRIAISAPLGSGFSRYIVNAGKIQNKGIEAVLSFDAYKSSKFSWKTNFNFTKNTNTVLELDSRLSDGVFYLTEPGVNNYGMVIREGGSFGDIFGKQFERDANGAIKVSDGKPVGGEFGVVGNINPKFLLGWNNNFEFGRFNLNFLIDGRFGGNVMSITQAMIDELGVSQATADARKAGGITFEGQKFDADKFYKAVGGRAGITEYYVYDATNIRLRELSVGYSFPKIKYLRNLKLSLVGRNLFFISKKAPFDPDLSMSTGTGLQGVDVFSLPSTRSIGLNLNVQF